MSRMFCRRWKYCLPKNLSWICLKDTELSGQFQFTQVAKCLFFFHRIRSLWELPINHCISIAYIVIRLVVLGCNWFSKCALFFVRIQVHAGWWDHLSFSVLHLPPQYLHIGRNRSYANCFRWQPAKIQNRWWTVDVTSLTVLASKTSSS